VGNAPASPPLEICPAVRSLPATECAQIANPIPGRTYKGKVSVPAPPAGKQSPLVVVALKKANLPPGEDYGQETVVADATIPIEVGANYDVAITGFETVTTRSTSTDTVFTSLSGMVKSNPPHPSDSPDACHLAGFSWCVFNIRYGDSEGGTHEIRNVRVSPYFLVPEREQDLRFLFFLDNHGENISQEIGLAVANGFSKAGMIVLSAYGAQSGSSTGSFAGQLDDAMEKLHSAETASCDGVLATDVVVITNTTIANQPQFTLDAFTRDTGNFSTTVPTVYTNKDGDLRCDRRGGNYRVSYTVSRTSWRDWGFRSAF